MSTAVIPQNTRQGIFPQLVYLMLVRDVVSFRFDQFRVVYVLFHHLGAVSETKTPGVLVRVPDTSMLPSGAGSTLSRIIM